MGERVQLPCLLIRYTKMEISTAVVNLVSRRHFLIRWRNKTHGRLGKSVLKICHPKGKGWSSKHQFSGASYQTSGVYFLDLQVDVLN